MDRECLYPGHPDTCTPWHYLELDGGRRIVIITPRVIGFRPHSALTVTVAAPSATEAEVASKAIFLAGPRAAQEAELLGTPAVIVGGDGHTRLAGGLA